MPYTAIDYGALVGMEGFSETLLKNHFTLYQGYVTNTNKLLDLLGRMLAEGKTATPEYAELKRRLGWEFNGMRLHELYFGNLAKSPKPGITGRLADAIAANFGGVDAWTKDFKATGSLRGIGWVVCYHDQTSGRLANTWINEHDTGHCAGCAPLLIMDVFEHAFMIDYGLKRADYIEAFFRHVDWEAVARRFRPGE